MRMLQPILILATVVGATAGEYPNSGRPAVLVCLNPWTNIVIVRNAEAAASRIFAEIGVELRWQPDLRYCTREHGGIVITLTEGTPNRHPGALAYASPYEGVHIVVYFDRVREAESPANVPTLLSHVMAHEIAHILQGADQHSREGIMKRRWESADYMQMRKGSLRFSSEDILLIQHGLDRRAGLASAQTK